MPLWTSLIVANSLLLFAPLTKTLHPSIILELPSNQIQTNTHSLSFIVIHRHSSSPWSSPSSSHPLKSYSTSEIQLIPCALLNLIKYQRVPTDDFAVLTEVSGMSGQNTSWAQALNDKWHNIDMHYRRVTYGHDVVLVSGTFGGLYGNETVLQSITCDCCCVVCCLFEVVRLVSHINRLSHTTDLKYESCKSFPALMGLNSV